MSEVSLSQTKNFPPLMWILLFGAFFTRGSYYMVWPFLAVILYNRFDVSATEVGLILTSAAVVGVFAGFIAGTLSDLLGRKTVLYGCGLLYIGSFCLLANANSVLSYTLVIALCSIATEIWRPSSSALIGDLIDDRKTRELAMQSLYFMVNVGAAVGPMVGFWLGLTAKPSTFYITAASFALFLVVLILGFHHQSSIQNIENTYTEYESHPIKEDRNFYKSVKVLLQDRMLQCLILANIVCMFIYGQMDSTLIQYLTRAQVPDLLKLISSMILTNALVIICSQFILLKLMIKMEIVQRIQIGLVLLTLSQIWMAFNPLDLFWAWIGAVIVMSLAETILFPTMNIHIDRIAPNHLRGAYFGATAFYSFGFALAPFGGGLMLDYIGGTGLYLICASLCLLVIYLYRLLDSLKRPVNYV